MFRKLYNEAFLSFQMHTKSPLFIGTGGQDQLDPTASDDTYLKVYRDGQLVPIIPGTAIKGVFRSCAEQIIKDACDIFGSPKSNDPSKRPCSAEARNYATAKERYKKSCPVCKLFGSTVIKSRINFNDGYPVGNVKTGNRSSIAIDRVTGAAKRSSLRDFEYIEDANFKCEIILKNFFLWQLKLIFEIFKRIDEGYATFGSLTSKGFGQIKINNVSICVRYYDKDKVKPLRDYKDKGLYVEKIVEGRDNILSLLNHISLNDTKVIERSDFCHDETL